MDIIRLVFSKTRQIMDIIRLAFSKTRQIMEIVPGVGQWHSEHFLYTTCSPNVLQKEELLTKILYL